MPTEFALIDRYFKRAAPRTVLGVGDDGAIVQVAPGSELVISTDMLVAGTHFLPDTDPENLGWKTLAVNISDLAAMAAEPRWALLAASLPEANEPWLAAFTKGLFDCAEVFGIDLVGGDTTRGPLNFCVTIFGEVPRGKALLRSGAAAGDEIWVSGQPGLAALGLAHLQGRCVLETSALADCLSALHRPQPRVALGLVLRELASAAIDISDGLLADLGHLLDASQVSATLRFEQVPHVALTKSADHSLAVECLLAGGDDYELLFTAPPARHDEINALSADLQLPLACIGTIESGAAGQFQLLDANGRPMTLERRGFDHFG